MKKKLLVLVAITITLMSSVVYASVGNVDNKLAFQKFKIYGSHYSLLATGYVQNSPYNKISVIVDNMYKFDGSKPAYSNSRWTFTSAKTGAVLVSDLKIVKGTSKSVTLTQNTSAGQLFGINVKGDDTDTNALISGAVDNFNKR